MKAPRLAAAVLAATLLTGTAAGTALADGTPPPAPLDAGFAKAAHQGNLAEIAAGKDARKHATTECVRDVGALLVRDHSKLDADLKALADKLDVKLPDAPTPEQQKTLDKVRAKAGTSAYDKAWLAAQDAAHRETLKLIDHQIDAGRNAEITAAAKAARPVVAMHLDLVRGGVCHDLPKHGKDGHGKDGKDGRYHVRAGHGALAAGQADAQSAWGTAAVAAAGGGTLLAAT
ncbi:DUF4142 domain-containing protein, partial [Streptomyces sp. YIM 98790]|uniref:DUF4142 domain-containing protein n=1 Tax=Streptomyces sp. YIM 98790 TaxID=2689077 RepID=UPI0028BEF8E7